MESPLNNQYLDEDDELYKNWSSGRERSDDIDEIPEIPDFEYKPTIDVDLSKFFRTECQLLEPERQKVKFRLYKDNVDYVGKVLKELDETHFIFLIERPERKMKKIDITDISLFID